MTYKVSDKDLWGHQQSCVYPCMGLKAQHKTWHTMSPRCCWRKIKETFQDKIFLIFQFSSDLSSISMQTLPTLFSLFQERAIARKKFRAQEALPGLSRVRRILSFLEISWIWKECIKRYSEAGREAVTTFGTEGSLCFDLCGLYSLENQARSLLPAGPQGEAIFSLTNGEIALPVLQIKARTASKNG